MAEPPSIAVPVPPRRADDTHKGSFGTVLVAAGSRAYPGAAVLTALGAGRAGAGLVRLAVPDALLPVVVAAAPFATLLSCAATDDGGLSGAAADVLEAEAASAGALVVGPGLGTADGTARLVRRLLRTIEIPLVLDADALNLLAADLAGADLAGADPARAVLADVGTDAPAGADRGPGPDDLRAVLARRDAPLVLLPHPGEFVRLARALDPDAPERPPRAADARRDAACALARALSAIVVLKGHGSVTTDGTRAVTEPAGNPGLATGGMGDVLAGVVGAVLAGAAGPGIGGSDDPAAAVALAVRLHAVAGDLAAAELGPEAVLPADVADRLGHAYEALRRA